MGSIFSCSRHLLLLEPTCLLFLSSLLFNITSPATSEHHTKHHHQPTNSTFIGRHSFRLFWIVFVLLLISLLFGFTAQTLAPLLLHCNVLQHLALFWRSSLCEQQFRSILYIPSLVSKISLLPTSSPCGLSNSLRWASLSSSCAIRLKHKSLVSGV